MEGRKDLLGILAGMMGGRVAEETFFEDVTSGAASDIKEATRIARLMVCSWGMSEDLGPQAFGENQELMFLGREVSRSQDYSEQTAQRIDAEVNKLLRDSHARAKQIIASEREKVIMVAELLLERETLDGRDVEDIVEFGRVLSTDEREKIDAEKTPVDGDDNYEPDGASSDPVEDMELTPDASPAASADTASEDDIQTS